MPESQEGRLERPPTEQRFPLEFGVPDSGEAWRFSSSQSGGGYLDCDPSPFSRFPSPD